MVKFFKTKEIELFSQNQTVINISGIDFVKLITIGRVENDIDYNSIGYYGVIDHKLVAIESGANSLESKNEVISMCENVVIE